MHCPLFGLGQDHYTEVKGCCLESSVAMLLFVCLFVLFFFFVFFKNLFGKATKKTPKLLSAGPLRRASNGNQGKVQVHNQLLPAWHPATIQGDVIKWKHFPCFWPVTRSFDVFFDLHLNKRLSKQSQGWWFETQSCSLRRHSNAVDQIPLISGFPT